MTTLGELLAEARLTELAVDLHRAGLRLEAFESAQHGGLRAALAEMLVRAGLWLHPGKGSERTLREV